ncbi:MAG: hypothetical protein ACOYK8_01060 [Alphaproteobacteria bacterium]
MWKDHATIKARYNIVIHDSVGSGVLLESGLGSVFCLDDVGSGTRILARNSIAIQGDLSNGCHIEPTFNDFWLGGDCGKGNNIIIGRSGNRYSQAVPDDVIPQAPSVPKAPPPPKAQDLKHRF